MPLEAAERRGKQAGTMWSRAASVVAVVFMAFHLYTAHFGVFEAYFQRSLDVTFILLLVFLIYPLSRRAPANRWFLAADVLSLILIAVIGYYSAANSEEILIRAGAATSLDLWLGGLLLLLVIEATRRAVGWPIVILTLVFFVYSLYGRVFPLAIAHGGYSLEEIITLNFMATDGLYGLILGVLSTYIIIFVIFSSFLEETGAVNFFINLANSLAGHFSGGPAKVAVVSSTLIGALSGSSAANVVTTGSFTIPLMKRMGYRPQMAGAVEAAASTGGQIMPPIMGASAFVIAAILGVSYLEVMKAALVPALLYFFSVGLVVHFTCRRLNLRGLGRSELPRFTEVMKGGWFLFLPVAAIVLLLLRGYTPLKAGMWAIIVILVVTAFHRQTRITPRKFVNALDKAGRGIVAVGVTGACAGIIVSFIVISGLGLRLTDLIQFLSGGNLLPALIFTMIASLILGMGMPTVGAYIIVATLGAPALEEMGVSPIAAHMFVFFFAIVCNVTPPVALAAYAAAPIAKSDPWSTGWLAFRYALAGFLVPYFFVYNNALLLAGSPGKILWSVLTAMVGVGCLAASTAGYFIQPASLLQRGFLILGALTLLHGSLLTDAAGVSVLVGLYFLQRGRMGRQKALLPKGEPPP
ncbi:MAG: TRAP transporter permease [Nitrospinota bacterium]